MINKYIIIILGIVFWFAIMFSSVYVYEYYHKFDYRNIEIINEDVCVLLNCGEGNLGYYMFDLVNEDDYVKVLKIREYTEHRAYLIQSTFILSCILSVLLFLYLHSKKQNKYIYKQ